MTTAIEVRQEAFSLTPSSLGEAMKLAELIANSDLAPRDYKGKPGNVLIAVQMGAEVGLSPMAAIQTIAVINGRPSLFGDSGKAILLSHGCIIEEDGAAKVRETGVGRCKITRPGHPPVERTFSKDDAKQAGLLGKDGPWKQYTERMLAWRAFWFAARDAAADLLKGLQGAEEVRDMPGERNMGAADVVPDRAETARAMLAGDRKPAPAKAKAPTLDDVLTAIRAATTPEQMSEAAGKCAALLDPAEKETGRAAYRERLNALKAQAQAQTQESGETSAGPTYADIADQIGKAQSTAALAAARDLIRSVRDDTQRSELVLLADRREGELTSAGGA